jgi:cyclophilin family peptidyl-prolyl cis-trans isomerase
MRAALCFLLVLGAIALLVSTIVAEGKQKVYTTYKEAKEAVYKTGRPLVVAFVRTGDTAFMGAPNSLFSDKAFEKIIGYFVLLQVEFNVGQRGTPPEVANPENAEIANKILLKEGGRMPTLAVVGRDEKVLRVFPQANPKSLLLTLPQEMADIVKQLKPLSPAEEEKFEEMCKEAEKALENKETDKAVEVLKKIAKSGKRCGYVEDAKKKIEELTKEKVGPTKQETPGDSEKTPKLEEGKEKVAVIDTDFGKIVVRLSPKNAPKAYERFIALASKGFYKNSGFHKVIKGEVIFGGFPENDPKKEPEESIDAEFSGAPHEEGTFAMEPTASDKKKINCEFCICLKKMSEIDRTDVVIGKVIEGLFVAKSIGDVKTMNRVPVNRVAITDIKIEEREAKK